MPAKATKTILANIGIDVASVLAFLSTLLPSIQAIVGICIGVVILLINIERYRKIRKSNKLDNGEE